MRTTDHTQLKMNHEDRRITEPELLRWILDRNSVCTIAMHDWPYPYIVPMNYGYVWEEKLVLYMHMAAKGHRLELLQENPYVACSISMFLDRAGKKKYKKEGHDYRSVTVFGKAEVVTKEDPEEFLKGLNALCRNTGRRPLQKVPGKGNLLVLKVIADIITSKAQYPVQNLDEIPMPPLE